MKYPKFELGDKVILVETRPDLDAEPVQGRPPSKTIISDPVITKVGRKYAEASYTPEGWSHSVEIRFAFTAHEGSDNIYSSREAYAKDKATDQAWFELRDWFTSVRWGGPPDYLTLDAMQQALKLLKGEK